jgi:heat shock protein HslJ
LAAAEAAVHKTSRGALDIGLPEDKPAGRRCDQEHSSRSRRYIDKPYGEKMKKIILVIILTSLALAACGSAGGSAALAGTTWKLVSYGSASNPTPAVSDAKTALTFDKDGKLSGNVGCNSISGDYTLNGEQVNFGAVVTTLMACADPLMQQESAVLKMFSGTVKYTVTSGQLTLTSADGATAVTFEQAAK